MKVKTLKLVLCSYSLKLETKLKAPNLGQRKVGFLRVPSYQQGGLGMQRGVKFRDPSPSWQWNPLYIISFSLWLGWCIYTLVYSNTKACSTGLITFVIAHLFPLCWTFFTTQRLPSFIKNCYFLKLIK